MFYRIANLPTRFRYSRWITVRFHMKKKTIAFVNDHMILASAGILTKIEQNHLCQVDHKLVYTVRCSCN